MSSGFSRSVRSRAGGSPSAARSVLPPSSRAISTSSRPETTDRGCSSAMSRRDADASRWRIRSQGVLLLLRSAPTHADQRPGALELLAVEPERQVARGERRVHVRNLRSPGAPVPDHDGAAAVFPLRNHAFEGVVLDGMVFGRHREPFGGGIERRASGDRPGLHDPFPLEAEIVVKRRGAMFLDDEGERTPAPARRAALRLGRHAESPLAPVLAQRRGAAGHGLLPGVRVNRRWGRPRSRRPPPSGRARRDAPSRPA